MPGQKNIAVLVKDRTEEALRMALGLTLYDDRIDVYLTGPAPAPTEMNLMNLEMLKAMKAGLYSICEAEDFKRVNENEMPQILLKYDVVITY
ncbi:MAG: hypothetical protein M0Z61_16165 [Nitrospiraceae bacterium]|nr:hypothetical protein [Nitrospiraceae bacterium]